MKTWNVILATLVIFVAGIATGALLVILSERAHSHAHRSVAAPSQVRAQQPLSPQSAPPTNAVAESNHEFRLTLPFGKPSGRGLGKEFLDRLDQELKLDADQHKLIGKIIEDSQKHTREVLRDEVKYSREKMRDVLTPEQRARLDELMKSRPPKAPENQPTNSVPLTSPPAETPAK